MFKKSHEEARKWMVENQIIHRGIHNKAVINAFLTVPRHIFVPDMYAHLAYHDFPLAIGLQQTISQPYMVALMTDKLNINQNDCVLEIGTGSGYQTAILSLLAKEVYTIERLSDLQQHAKSLLDKLNSKNIYYKIDNGYQGWSAHAPFDAIIVTAAPKALPDKLVDQLKIGGRMIVPIGDGNLQELLLVIKRKNRLEHQFICHCRFVEMVDDI